MIQLTKVSKSYNGVPALLPIDLAIPAGSVTALIGPSGCGKSTVIRIISGLVRPDTGNVSINGQQVTAGNLISLRRKIGYVIQDGGLFPHLTAGKNVSLLAQHLGWKQNRIANRLNELAELTHLSAEILSRYPAELSGGQRQRVSLMRALMLQPDVLLLDEPLGALDPMVRSSLQQELKSIISQSSQTVLLVTHDLSEAAYLADKIVLLNEGRVVQDGTLQQMQQSPASPFVSDFLKAQRSLVSL